MVFYVDLLPLYVRCKINEFDTNRLWRQKTTIVKLELYYYYL